MEFPHMGKNCSNKSCNKLDFLPFTCNACKEVFCAEHFRYSKHDCSLADRNNVQVPVCPLCGEPVPTPPGISPDQTVGAHIDSSCRSETKKIFTNRCTYRNCKKKELVPFNCSECKMNFCLRHRHSADHECLGPKSAQRKLIANAAEKRLEKANEKRDKSKSTPTRQNNNFAETIQNNMSEDEALARALALSIMELDEISDRNRRNQQTTVQSGTSSTSTSETKDRCSLS